MKKSKNNAGKNKIQVNFTNSGLRDLTEKFEDMSKQEKEIENPNVTVDVVKMILEFNRQQQGQGPKILSPSQMLSKFL